MRVLKTHKEPEDASIYRFIIKKVGRKSKKTGKNSWS